MIRRRRLLASSALTLTAAAALAPVVLAARVAFTPHRAYAASGAFAPLGAFTWDNVARAFDTGLASTMATTAVMAIVVTIVQVPTTFLTAFTLACRPAAMSSRVLRALLIGGYLLPPITLAIPVYLGVSAAGLRGTFPGIVLPVLFVSPFAVFLFLRAIQQMPPSVIDAARIDGAGPPRLLRSIAAPLCAPAIGAVSALSLAAQWNAFLWPSLVAAGRIPVVTTAIASMNGQYDRDWTLVMAASCISLAPPLLVAAGTLAARPLLVALRKDPPCTDVIAS
ncbi:carbohydrate ABC transporter permease [Microbacterium sp. NPDC055683]